MHQPISEIARIRQDVEAEHEATQRGMSGNAACLSPGPDTLSSLLREGGNTRYV
jgi:hypothetical protein